ncbi:fumarylacetoacetate hydrolase family protein [Virgibacillus natechei]|uniref:fumarylacetoacetate hydrolase family protein n=1 Tax=Virgibacillus sp. CBA3643 TaxID=2942278 RepID=UPI0035A2FA77
MKYLRFYKNGEVKYGLLEEDTITELNGNFLSGKVEQLDSKYNLSEVKLLPPVEPGKIIAVGLNYSSHAKEMGRDIPDEPMIFMVSPTAIIGNDDYVSLPNINHKTDYEAELAVVIGKKAKDVKRDKALPYVYGYTCANDISDRDLQKKDVQFTRAKSYDTFKPLGPVISTNIDGDNANISLSINGVIKQQSNTEDFIHNVSALIEEITKVMTLYPGDVILTGTPSGVGSLKPGDNIELHIEGIGTLRNKVNKVNKI